jgi:iron complex outermembrane receptor protein
VRQLPRDAFSASVFAGGRSLYNPLTFAIVDVGRRTYGASGRVTHVATIAARQSRFTTGLDFQSQNDSRLNFTNCNASPPLAVPTATCGTVGEEEGTRTLDQREIVSGVGVFVSNETTISSRLRASAGLRADNVTFEVQDHLISPTNPDDSGDRALHALTPYIGLVARVESDRSVYANISSAFETPTATELGNHPDGSAGINQDLKPQKSTTYEIGFKGFAVGGTWLDVATFITKAKDELVPFEIPSSGGRRYFRNAGRTTRRGAELGITSPIGPLSASASYTYSDFRFDKYSTGASVFDGRRIPGIPMHRAQASLTARRRSMFAVAEGEVASRSFADDANTARAPGYGIMNLRAGVESLFGSPFVSLVAGAQNLFNRAYAPSISVNAAAGKFFEPAPGRMIYVALALRSHD